MKSLIKVLGGMVLCALFIFFGAQLLFTQESNQIRRTEPRRAQDSTLRHGSESPTAQETYVSEVVISAPWAEKNLVYDGEVSPPGEFGIHEHFSGTPMKLLGDGNSLEGPTSFTVAPGGDIYVTDPLNERIQRFDAEGHLVSVIPDIEGSHWDWSLVCVDRRNNVYLLWWHDVTEQSLRKYGQEGKLLNTYSVFRQARMPVCGTNLRCDSADTLLLQYWTRSLGIAESLKLKQDYRVKGSVLSLVFQIGTADSVFTSAEQQRTLRGGVMAIPDLGDIVLAEIEEPVGEPWGPRIWNYEFVDERKNFYRYRSTRNGVHVIKWHKP